MGRAAYNRRVHNPSLGTVRLLPAFLPCLIMLFAWARVAPAQTFTRITDPAIAAVVDTCSSASWADVDNDGDLDLFVTTWSSNTPNLLFRNDGAPGFTKLTVPDLDARTRETFGSAWVDVNNDGWLDLYTSQLFNDGGALYRNSGGGTLTRLGGALITGATIKGNGAWADFDLDGDVDLVLACLNGTGGIATANRLFINNGGFSFVERDTTALAGVVDTHHTASWADYDNDGDPDLFFATGGVGVQHLDRLYRNMLKESGVAFFTPLTDITPATDLHDSQLYSWADYDNDGDLDAYVLNYTSLPNYLYRNNGNGTFARITTAGAIVTDVGQSHGCAWGDFDNDGDLDVYVARDGGQTNRFYRNNGNSTFTSVVTGTFVTLGRSNWNAVAGDYDRDGDLDLFAPVRDAADAGMLFRNDLASGAHWLEVRMVGVQSNRSAIGARVKALATIGGAPRWQMREISASTGYGGHNMLDAHLGLGDATVVDSLLFEWPSGQRDTLTNVAVDTVMAVVEGHQLLPVEPAGRGALSFRVEGPTPNPGRGASRWTLAIADAGAFTYELFDVTGRLRSRLDAGHLAAGVHTLVTPAPEGLEPGVYLARWSGGADVHTRRVAIIR